MPHLPFVCAVCYKACAPPMAVQIDEAAFSAGFTLFELTRLSGPSHVGVAKH